MALSPVDPFPAKSKRPHLLTTAFSGRHVLVVEDEVLIAMDIEYSLRDVGALVVGPASNLRSATDLVSTDTEIDAAILDIDLGGEDVFPVATILEQRGIPFVFHTGHGATSDVNMLFPSVALCSKPVRVEDLLAELAGVLRPPSAA